jgi:S-formylglutathione hydrolase FrmB
MFQLRHVSPAERSELRFYIAVGADDTTSVIEENEAFVAKCKELNVPVRFDRDKGNHKWGFWRGHFRIGLTALAGWWGGT